MPILSQSTAKAHSQTTKRRVRGCFKKRSGLADKLDQIVPITTDRGFTEHEHLDEVGVIHMNGRIYDPLLGRFMSADPFIQAPFELQSHNRYAYVMNNPLGYTDPSGYFLKWVSDQVHNVSNTATNILQPLEGAAKVGVVFAAAYYTGQWAMAAGYGAVGAGAIGGFAGGFAGSAINGGNLEQSIKGGLIGGATGAAFGYVGGSYAAGTTGSYVGHGVVGCVSSVAGGGKCSSGAAAAVFGKWATNSIGGTPGKFDAYQFAATAVAGGVGSVIGGGKFLNGATTAAYGYLFNQMSRAAGAGTCRMMCGAGATRSGGDADGMVSPRMPPMGMLAAGLDAYGNLVLDSINGNSWLSPQPNWVYQLVSLDDGSLQKYGITNEVNPQSRYTSAEYAAMNVRMETITRFESRAPARMLEIGLCGAYVVGNGKLPPQSSRC